MFMVILLDIRHKLDEEQTGIHAHRQGKSGTRGTQSTYRKALRVMAYNKYDSFSFQVH
jgi:hypothetical protein